MSFQIWVQDNNSFRMILKNSVKKARKKSKLVNKFVNKLNFVWRKKNPPRAQIFRYFRIKSRNNKRVDDILQICISSIWKEFEAAYTLHIGCIVACIPIWRRSYFKQTVSNNQNFRKKNDLPATL